MNDVILGTQATKEQHVISKVLFEEDKMKRSSVSWPSSLFEAFKRSRDVEKLRTKLTIDAFRSTYPMPPPILSPRIVHIDEGSPTRKPEQIPEEPLVPPLSKLIITQSGQQLISSITSQNVPSKDKGKGILHESDSLVKSKKKFDGWSKKTIPTSKQ